VVDIAKVFGRADVSICNHKISHGKGANEGAIDVQFTVSLQLFTNEEISPIEDQVIANF
jgi:hypothetical protein